MKYKVTRRVFKLFIIIIIIYDGTLFTLGVYIKNNMLQVRNIFKYLKKGDVFVVFYSTYKNLI